MIRDFVLGASCKPFVGCLSVACGELQFQLQTELQKLWFCFNIGVIEKPDV